MLGIVVNLKIRKLDLNIAVYTHLMRHHFESDTAHNPRFTRVVKSNQKISPGKQASKPPEKAL